MELLIHAFALSIQNTLKNADTRLFSVLHFSTKRTKKVNSPETSDAQLERLISREHSRV